MTQPGGLVNCYCCGSPRLGLRWIVGSPHASSLRCQLSAECHAVHMNCTVGEQLLHDAAFGSTSGMLSFNNCHDDAAVRMCFAQCYQTWPYSASSTERASGHWLYSFLSGVWHACIT